MKKTGVLFCGFILFYCIQAFACNIFRRILALAPQVLASTGWLCVELSEDNVEQAAELCRAAGGWARVEVRRDLTRQPRVLVAVREG